MYAVIGNNDAKLSLPTLSETEVATHDDLFESVEKAEQYIEEQTGLPTASPDCPLRVVAVCELTDRRSREELYAGACDRVAELANEIDTIQTALADAPPIEPAGSHIDQRNAIVERRIAVMRSTLDRLERLTDELRHR